MKRPKKRDWEMLPSSDFVSFVVRAVTKAEQTIPIR